MLQRSCGCQGCNIINIEAQFCLTVFLMQCFFSSICDIDKVSSASQVNDSNRPKHHTALKLFSWLQCIVYNIFDLCDNIVFDWI